MGAARIFLQWGGGKNRGAAPRGERSAKGVSPSLADYGVYWSVMSSPSRVRGTDPATNVFLAYFRNRLWWTEQEVLLLFRRKWLILTNTCVCRPVGLIQFEFRRDLLTSEN